MSRRSPSPPRARRQRGVVLIIALVMLVIISLLATFSIRNTVSSEAVSGNVRTTQLASQAAEVALRFCEDVTVRYVRSLPAGGTITYPATASDSSGANTLTLLAAASTTPRAYSTTIWDTASANTAVIPSTEVNQTSTVTFNRMPECMVENVPVVEGSGTLNTTSTFLVTARGFGPEVAADASRGRPNGSEVWLQSTIEIQ